MILDDLYNSEINFKIATDWDAGWTVALGNEYRASLPKRTFGLSTTRANGSRRGDQTLPD